MTLAALALGVVLSITPTSGKAPLPIVPTFTVTGPFEGFVCLEVTVKDSGEHAVLDCEIIVVPDEKPVVLKDDEMTGGKSGKTYIFKAFISEEPGVSKPAAESNEVEVTLE